MKSTELFEQTVLEMTPAVTGARVERVRQLGSLIFLFTLFGRGGQRLLAMSLEREGSGLHLLFEKIHNGYLRSSPLTCLFEKYLKGGRIGRVKADGGLVELEVRRGGEYLLVLRVREGTVELSEGGGTLFSASRRGGEMKLSFDGETADVEAGGAAGETAAHSTDGFQAAGYPLNEDASRSLVEFVNERLRREMKKRIGREAARVERLLSKLDSEKAETLEKDDLRKKGELMKVHLRDLRKGMVSASLADPGGARVRVELDPALTPLENMNNLFKRYRKMKSRERYIDGNILRQREKRSALAEFSRALDARGLPNVGSGDALRLLDGERAGRELRNALEYSAGSGRRGRLTPGGSERAKEPAAAGGKKPFLRFTSRTGKIIYAGRNAGENDTLSTRVARGNDLWFHALGGAGSHVVLRYDKKGEFRESDIADASLLALYFSKLRKRGEGDVVYTYCKNVRKPKNAPPGAVSYHHDKTRYVRIEEGALGTLMGGERRAQLC
jgi:predicted ribosome quality control (RQC) complex YloA/Tae2 family protein